jgi:signal transduction histidine kinase
LLRYLGLVIRRFLGSYGELVLVAGLGVLAQVELWVDAEWADHRRTLAPLALAMTAALLLRLRAPVLALLLEIAAFVAVGVILADLNNDPMALVLMVLVAVYSAGAHTRGRTLFAAAVLVAAAVVAGMVQDGESLNVSGLLFFGFFLGGPFLAGVVIRIRREREGLLVRERDERARAAVLEERTRVARELHDVVAHAISVIVLQARGARRSLATEPETARGALDAIEQTASQALAEMRRLLEMLRADDDQVGLAPQPSLAHVDTLAGQVAEAGLPVEVAVEGEPRELAPGVDLAAFRIVQEALTNALKHAGPARARVLVRYGADDVELEIADDGAGSANGDAGGHGLAGMRERVSLYGGRLEAGPGTGGGFLVRARLPG